MKTLTLLLALVSLNLFGQALVTVGEDKSPPKAVIESGRAAQRSEPQPPLEYVKPQDTASTDTVAAEPAVTAAIIAACRNCRKLFAHGNTRILFAPAAAGER